MRPLVAVPLYAHCINHRARKDPLPTDRSLNRAIMKMLAFGQQTLAEDQKSKLESRQQKEKRSEPTPRKKDL